MTLICSAPQFPYHVYIAALAGHVPSEITQCLSTFMDLCYIFHRNAITSTALSKAEALLDRFHNLHQFFVHAGVCTSMSLPRQHALLHYITSIPLFASLNGLCSSITESKYIKAVKEPWRRSSHFNALPQMLCTIVQLDKLSALQQRFLGQGMLLGCTAGYVTRLLGRGNHEIADNLNHDSMDVGAESDEHNQIKESHDIQDDVGAVDGPQALSSIRLASTPGIFELLVIYSITDSW
jgi:hypothetical protein